MANIARAASPGPCRRGRLWGLLLLLSLEIKCPGRVLFRWLLSSGSWVPCTFTPKRHCIYLTLIKLPNRGQRYSFAMCRTCYCRDRCWYCFCHRSSLPSRDSPKGDSGQGSFISAMGHHLGNPDPVLYPIWRLIYRGRSPQSTSKHSCISTSMGYPNHPSNHTLGLHALRPILASLACGPGSVG